MLYTVLFKIHTLVLTATRSQTQADVIRNLSNSCEETQSFILTQLILNSKTFLRYAVPAVLQTLWHITSVCRKPHLSETLLFIAPIHMSHTYVSFQFATKYTVIKLLGTTCILTTRHVRPVSQSCAHINRLRYLCCARMQCGSEEDQQLCWTQQKT